jgi:hypothetical protein
MQQFQFTVLPIFRSTGALVVLTECSVELQSVQVSDTTGVDSSKLLTT